MNADPRLIPLARRNPRLMCILLADLEDAAGPIPWNDLVETHSSDAHPWKTVENTIYDLIAFGAVHKIGGYKGRADTRALKLTPLGRAWTDRDRIPFLTEDDEDQADGS